MAQGAQSHYDAAVMNNSVPRPGWIAQLQGHSFDLAYWERSLNPPYDPVFERIPNGDNIVWGLRSSAFDNLQSADEVRVQAIILIATLNGALRVQCGAEPLTFQGVARIDDGGNFHFTVFAEAHARGRAMLTATAEVRNADGKLVPRPPPRPSQIQRWVQAGEQDEDIADLLHYAGQSDNWYDIYKALELTKRVAGGKNELDALLKNSADVVENMRVTANFFRHARAYRPPVLTTLEEAKSLMAFAIRTVLAARLPNDD